jgi:predicted RNA-binding Zn-ribbon protein involved in translation (DUF1610 family)
VSDRTVACPHCGEMNAKTKLCRACGGKLQPDAEAPAPDAEAATSAYCPSCGAQQVAGDKFCRQCGAAQSPATAAQIESPSIVVRDGTTNGLAIASFVFALIGGALLAVVFGHIALGQIKKSGQQGNGLAVAGVLIGWIEIAVAVIFLLFFLARPSPAPF